MGVEGTLHDNNAMLFVAAAIDARIATLPLQIVNQLQLRAGLIFRVQVFDTQGEWRLYKFIGCVTYQLLNLHSLSQHS